METPRSVAVPFIVNAIMFGVKKLTGYRHVRERLCRQAILRFVLILLSLIGIVSSSLVPGVEIDAGCATMGEA